MKSHISDQQRQELEQVAAQQHQSKPDRATELARLIQQQRRNGFCGPDGKVRWHLSQADTLLMRGLVRLFGENAQWLPEYDEVASWLSDNQGKGLFLIGDCGRGKTVITQQIFPVLFQYYMRRTDGSRMAYNCTTAKALADNYDEFSRYKILCIDDIGTEGKVRKFGNVRDYVEDLVDVAEKEQKLLVLSTNLTFDQLQQRYDMRTIDRLRGLTTRVFFEGQSLRQ